MKLFTIQPQHHRCQNTIFGTIRNKQKQFLNEKAKIVAFQVHCPENKIAYRGGKRMGSVTR